MERNLRVTTGKADVAELDQGDGALRVAHGDAPSRRCEEIR